MTEQERTQQADALLDQYREMHRAGHFQGIGCLAYQQEIYQWVQQTHSTSLLDYGCGKGRQFRMSGAALHRKAGVYADSWAEALGVTDLVGYDPAWEPYSVRPRRTFDGVYCISVLEHLDAQDIPDILDDIFHYADKFVYLVIGIVPAKKNLPNGKNAHVTLKPIAWWIEEVEAVAQRHAAVRWHLQEESGKNDDRNL